MALRVIGKTFIVAGVIILLFVAYELFGTNIVTDRHQAALASELEARLRAKSSVPPATEGPEKPSPYGTQPFATVDSSPRPESSAKLDLGEGIAIIRIPKIGVERVVVEGVSVEALKRGPGHYPDTAAPGEAGNMVISGHRTTYGAPFKRLDELEAGDEISLTTVQGHFIYSVTERRIVAPSEVSVLNPTEDARLTLTTCHPKFSARQRLIVLARLQEREPLPSSPARPGRKGAAA